MCDVVAALWKMTFTTLVLGVVGYFVVMVPLGQKTLFEHGVAIWRTPEAQDLRQELADTGQQVGGRITRTLQQ